MKLANFLKAKSPLTGEETSLTDVGGIFSMILGVVLLLFVVATGQNVAGALQNKFGGKIDTSIQPLVQTPSMTAAAPRVI